MKEIRKYWLSTEGYYFEYHKDREEGDTSAVYQNTTIAILYKEGKGHVDAVAVKDGVNPPKSHDDVINYFEARITLRLI